MAGFPYCQGCIHLQTATHTSFEPESGFDLLIAERVKTPTCEA